MTEDLVRGMLGDGLVTELLLSAATKQMGKNPSNLYIACRDEESCTMMREKYNAHAVTDAMEFLPKVKILVLAFGI